jgi:hypothetical protein
MKHITTLIRRYFLRNTTDIPALEIVVYDDAVEQPNNLRTRIRLCPNSIHSCKKVDINAPERNAQIKACVQNACSTKYKDPSCKAPK